MSAEVVQSEEAAPRVLRRQVRLGKAGGPCTLQDLHLCVQECLPRATSHGPGGGRWQRPRRLLISGARFLQQAAHRTSSVFPRVVRIGDEAAFVRLARWSPGTG